MAWEALLSSKGYRDRSASKKNPDQPELFES